MAIHNEIGKLGEDLACEWLSFHGFTIHQRNYRKKCGEIDIVAIKSQKIHFVEVKTVSYETTDNLYKSLSRETWRPEENVHTRKLIRLSHTIQLWLIEYSFEHDFQIDILTLRIVPREKVVKFDYLQNVIID